MGSVVELANSNDNAITAGTHPEEMRASVYAQFGPATFQASARMTPAGVVAGALFVAVVAGAAILALRSVLNRNS